MLIRPRTASGALGCLTAAPFVTAARAGAPQRRTAPNALAQHVITPIGTFCGRNHGVMPRIDPTWGLQLDGMLERVLNLSLPDLARRFDHHEVAAGTRVALVGPSESGKSRSGPSGEMVPRIASAETPPTSTA